MRRTLRTLALAASLAVALPGPAGASAMLATTPACEVLSEAELGKMMGQKLRGLGGTADIAYLSDCFWQSEGGGPSLEFVLMEEELLSPSGQTARSYLEQNMDAMDKAGSPFEHFPDIGDGAVLSEAPDTIFISLASGGDYLSIRLTGGKRATILKIAEAAARKMRAR